MLAGLRPSAGSPLLPLSQSGAWQAHADRFNTLFANADNRQLKRIRAWSSAKLKRPEPSSVLHVQRAGLPLCQAFFPNATTYVMAGLEPTGPIPDLSRFSRESLGSGLRGIEVSLRSILTYSFFITKEMRSELNATRMNGTLPILYVFLARSGKTIREASLFRLDQNGMPQPENTRALRPTRRAAPRSCSRTPRGVKRRSTISAPTSPMTASRRAASQSSWRGSAPATRS